jgi:exodeoxyribonuclease VII small subunit
MAETTINYEAAMRELEEIVSKMENGTMNLDDLSKNLKKAQELITLCRNKLTKTEEEISKLLNKE